MVRHEGSGAGRRRLAEQGGTFMKTSWNPLAYISDYGWTCIVCVAGAALCGGGSGGVKGEAK